MRTRWLLVALAATLVAGVALADECTTAQAARCSNTCAANIGPGVSNVGSSCRRSLQMVVQNYQGIGDLYSDVATCTCVTTIGGEACPPPLDPIVWCQSQGGIWDPVKGTCFFVSSFTSTSFDLLPPPGDPQE